MIPTLGASFVGGLGSAVLCVTLDRVARFGLFAWRKIAQMLKIDKELSKLEKTFIKVRGLVDMIEGNHIKFLDRGKAWQVLCEDLMKISYDVDAFLDRILLYHPDTDQETQISSLISSPRKRADMSEKISKLQLKLDNLVKELEDLLIIEQLRGDYCKSKSFTIQFDNFHSSASFVENVNAVGRVHDKDCIMDSLRKECERGNFSVIPIVGMAGIGKTALARLVYDDDSVHHIFDKRIWVSVSADFDLIRIMKSIIECATVTGCNFVDLNSLQVMLQHILCGRTYLLVLDDYWSESYHDWDALCQPFKVGAKGSKIIVTTRSVRVSSIVSSSKGHKLEILSDDDCWSLIRQRALVNVDLNENLEVMGREIAKKCKGLPLAAVTLARALHCKSTEEEWRPILESEFWDSTESESVFYSLLTSYLHLPPHLQRCLVYCSIFPENHEFDVEDLVLMWMAEGFIQPRGTRRLEDLGMDYFNELYERSLFQQCSIAPNQAVYKMHELVRDMVRSISYDICCHVKYSMANCYLLFGSCCHMLLLHDNDEPLRLEASVRNRRLRTFIVMGNGDPGQGEIDHELFQNLKYLRVLGLGYIGVVELPDSMEKMIYLRYLNLSGNLISCVPDFVCKFEALQTLKLRDCPLLTELPKDMGDLSELRHLELDVNNNITVMPLHLGGLTSLQTLTAYTVGQKDGNGIQELRNMNGLRGSLCIKNLDLVSNAADAAETELGMKTCLDKIELEWRTLRDGLNLQLLNQRKAEQAQVFENVNPHVNLKHLVIQNYCGDIYPGWISDSLRKFTRIDLKGLKYCENLPSLGQLPFLRSFAISGMPHLEHVDLNFYGTSDAVKFPSLESFELARLPMLIDWIDESDTAMPRLVTFKIDDCPNLISLPPRFLHIPNSEITNCPELLQPAP